ncbi:MAG: CBS domain-containing protein [Peptococcaceae bacterium]|jgi:acetoin utilization protein AcuB|nr:CBS domain-containing protein [Peptococcaceae bacterium]
MYVQQFMASKVITVPPNENILNAMNIMKNKRINRLPVVSNGKLVGLVSDGDLRAASPSPVTTLSKFEMNELLSKINVIDVAVKKVITCTPDTLIEDAALLMREHKVGALPVMEGDKIVGIITHNDILDAYLDIMGVRSPGKRIVIEVRDEVGVIYKVTTIITNYGIDITNLAVYHLPNRKAQIFLRLDGERVEEAIQELNSKGFTIIE